ncbi:S8 family serine peptidase [Paenibacillus barengoltzii]
MDYDDDQGHGTHIAGTISAINNGTGVVGVAPNADVFAVKVVDSSGTGYTSSVIQGIEWAIQNNINIINMSFVSSQYSEMLHDAIKKARAAGIIIVAAAGNIGLGENSILYPAAYPEVVAVGAVDQSYHRLDFSSTGNELDLVAPGFGITSTTFDGGYGLSSGTSTAAAHVTGAAALLWAHHPSWTADEVLSKLYESATPLGNVVEYGKGLINIAKAEGIITGSIAPLSDENLTGLNSIIPTNQTGEIELASYDKKNDGATIFPGDSITVSLKLEGDQNGQNPHQQIIVEVTSVSNPNQIVASATITNPRLDVEIPYTWSTTPSTPTGTYLIKYRYPALPSGLYDDTFVIYVAQPGVGPDTYEPNDTVYSAKSVSPNNSYLSYVSSSSDVDYYKLVPDKAGEITFDLSIPTSVDFELSVYDDSGIQVGRSSNGTGVDEQIVLQVAANKTYFIKITGFFGQFSTLPYTLSISPIEVQRFPAPTGLETVSFSNSIKLSWDPMPDAKSYTLKINGKEVGSSLTSSYTFLNLIASQAYILEVAAVYQEGTSKFSSIEASTTIPELILHEPVDIEQISGSSQLFSFKPASTGVYRFYTGPFGGMGSDVDTQIGIYSDLQLSKALDTNDDANDSVFSEIMISLVGGETYYVMVQGYDTTPLRARITADVVSSTIPYIYLNQPVDINEQRNDSNVYVFVPAENGAYRFTTGRYRGLSESKNNDTELSVYSDPEMESTVGYNDDSPTSSFSEVVVNLSAGTPYYVRVKEVNGGKVYARLLVSSAGSTSFTPLQLDTPLDLTKPSGEHAYLQFTPNYTGKYRFFTSNLNATSLLNDTEISLYSDVGLKNLLDSNDDVKGYKPYGELFSKLEVNLTAGATYYLVVRNASSREGLQTRLTVESMEQDNAVKAQLIPFDELIERDPAGNLLSVSSLYDVDYYKIVLSQPEQLSFYLSEGEGVIEDVNGNVRGYFSLDNQQVFGLGAGTYYLRIEDEVLHYNRQSSAWGFTAYNYELSVNINSIEYIRGNYGESSNFRILSLQNDTSLDATPGSGDYAKVKYKLTRDASTVYVEVYTQHGFPVYKTQKTGSYKKNTTIDVTWNGVVNPYTPAKNYYANYSEIYTGMPQYYAKNGSYYLYVYSLDSKNRKKNVQQYILNVFNDPLNKLNVVPPPPVKMNNKKITAYDRDKCQVCQNYFNTYVLGPNDNVALTSYDAWFSNMYGMTGLQQFWKGAEDLFLCNKGSAADQLQCTLDTIGLIPVIGDGADAVNGVIYLIRGKNAEALLSAGAIVPVVGSFVTGGKKVTYTGAKAFKRIYRNNPCGCLPEGTSITTKDGIKPIEQVRVGDLVLAKDTETGIQAYQPVEKLFNSESEEIFTIKIGDTQIDTTGNHPFWVKGKGWVPAEDLQPGDQLETEDGGLVSVDALKVNYKDTKVYNFTVSGFHTYYISDLGILTHNLLEVCEIQNYAKVSPKRLTNRKSNVASEILEAEIKKATGMDKPYGWAAHHIVPNKSSNKHANELRDILTKNGIDLNSSANGVYLPRERGVSTTVIDGQTMATHNGGHAESYYKFVLDQIEPLENNPDQILNRLNYIRNELLNGRLKLGNIDN